MYERDKVILEENPMQMCAYGCGKEALFLMTSGKWCCSNNHQGCSEVIKKRHKDRKIKVVHIEVSYMMCSYGCGKFAKYFFSNAKKWCCSNQPLKCSKVHAKTILSQTPIKIETTNEICSYGCGQLAHYKLPKSGKYCCSKNWACCPEVRKKNSKTNSKKQKGKNNARFGVKVSDETRRKIRLGNIRDLQNKHGQIFPNYNKKACEMIEKFGKENGYNFIHAENGGEFHIKELGYWVDGYDKDKNVVIEVDEEFHFDYDGNLLDSDVRRQKEIEEFLHCKFIRIKNF